MSWRKWINHDFYFLMLGSAGPGWPWRMSQFLETVNSLPMSLLFKSKQTQSGAHTPTTSLICQALTPCTTAPPSYGISPGPVLNNLGQPVPQSPPKRFKRASAKPAYTALLTPPCSKPTVLPREALLLGTKRHRPSFQCGVSCSAGQDGDIPEH